MGIFDRLHNPDINQGVAEYRATYGALLLDVRTPEEYHRGHIPGSRNLPLDSIGGAEGLPEEKATPIFVHCLSGVRSGQATDILGRMGYTRVKNIGGISRYRGEVEY